MFGFIFGTACLIGLTVMVARGPHGRFRRHYRRAKGFFLGALLERLDTTPGQEKAIRSAIDDFTESTEGVRRELFASREDIARAVRGEILDSRSLEDAFRRHDAAIGDLRNAFVNALTRVHETLDDRQRRTLAELIESEPWAFAHGHHHRHHHGYHH